MTCRFVLFPILATVAFAQSHTLSLSEAIAEAESNHAASSIANERVAAAEGLRQQAGLGLNPRLYLQSENTRFWQVPALAYSNDTDTYAYISQVFETAGKRARRRELADSGIRISELDRALTRRQIAAKVSLTYWSAVAASRIKTVIEENVNTFEKIVQYHRDRVREGAIAELDLMRVLLERDRLVVSERTAEQEYQQGLISLQRDMGRRSFDPALRLSDSLSEVHDVPLPEMQEILLTRIEITAGQANVERAHRNLALQQSLAQTDPEVLFGYKRTGGYDTMIGGVQWNLPLRNRNQGQIASAQAEIRVAENQARLTESQVRSEVEAARSAYEARKKLLTETLGPMQQRADEIARIALAAYQEGGFDLLRLIDAQRARLETLNLYYRALAEYQQSVTTLQIVTGARL